MAHTELFIAFRLWGPNIDPDYITKKSGVVPSRAFRAGEQGKPNWYVYDKAGWEWETKSAEDDEELWYELINALTPAVPAIRHMLKHDPSAHATVNIVGDIYYDLITTAEGLEEHNYLEGHAGQAEPYSKYDQEIIEDLPTLHGEPGQALELMLNDKVIAFLASINAHLHTHLAALLEDENPSKQ